MSNLVFNPQCKDYFNAKACLAISRHYNYAGSVRSCSFKYLSFENWSSSYRSAFSYVLGKLEDCALNSDFKMLSYSEIFDLSFFDGSWSDFYCYLKENMPTYFFLYCFSFTASEKLSFTYKLLDIFVRYNLGEVRFDLVSPMFEIKSAISYVASKYFPDTPFIDIESDFMFKNVMD